MSRLLSAFHGIMMEYFSLAPKCRASVSDIAETSCITWHPKVKYYTVGGYGCESILLKFVGSCNLNEVATIYFMLEGQDASSKGAGRSTMAQWTSFIEVLTTTRSSTCLSFPWSSSWSSTSRTPFR